MRIEKIELIGFKSFADRTTFALHPGITCIVGPNGCGKSNVVDAFRWVLGEQSAKSLRGEKMEEVIFNGSASKKPKGMAEVSMIISGLNGPAGENGGAGDLVTISRRLYRSGESEYMINKSACRLKDIKDIFLDTGLDFRSYSILEQGRIGEIINSKPLERRFIIEEVAGVMKYKVRKAEALSKLESSRTNLVRINDIIAELKKQLNLLDRLARKAERYKKLSAEMHAIELKMARREYQQMKEAYEAVLEEHGRLKESETSLGAEISDTENRTESRRLSVLEKEKELEVVQNGFQAMEREIAEIERSVAVGRKEAENFREYQVRLSAQEEELAGRIVETSQRCDDLRTNGNRLAGELESTTGLLREKTEAFREIEDELAEREEQVEDKRREAFRISEELSGLRNDASKQRSLLESLERREASARQEADGSRSMLAGLETSMNEVEAAILGSTNETLVLKEKKDALTRDLMTGRERLADLAASLSAVREELASCVSRLASLQEVVFDAPTRELLASSGRVKMLASLSDVMEVDAEYERSVEAALAEKADAFIMESVPDIEAAVSLLREAGGGKTAFLSVSEGPGSSGAVLQYEGGVAAINCVRVRDGFAAAARDLLANIVVVKDLHTALQLGSPDRGTTFVTIDGEVVEPSGAVIAGAGQGIFKRKREMRELRETIEEKKSAVETLNEDIRREQETIRDREEGIASVESSLRELEKQISLSKMTVDNYASEKERTNRKLAYLTLEIEEASREQEALLKAVTEIEQRVQAVEAKRAGVEEETSAIQESILTKKSEIEERRAEVTELRLLAASTKERIEANRNEIEASAKVVEDLTTRTEQVRAERETVILRISQCETGVTEQEERLRGLVARADSVRLEISGKKEAIEAEREDLAVVDQGLKSLRQQLSSMRARLSELDVGKAEYKLRIENLSENVRINYGVNIGEVELVEISGEEEERLTELRTKIQEMGPVNLGTLEEYEELRGRYDFLTKQQEDLTKSIAELEEAISKINSTTRRKLREAFEVLNAKFGEVFTGLFGGGRAELVLTDEQNILESGVDIISQPPGKKLQNIHLLSGGEKALTALAIQFASFLIKPTPLCILDEADAPLDESNTDRFSRMIGELSAETQFIVVTHNRTTMSVAQHLYGITMEEAGVSKVISMQLAEAVA